MSAVPPAAALPEVASPEAAAALAAALPPLLLRAERIAATLAAGAHGRRRAGAGDRFWQYRPYAPGDPPGRIAWRLAARSGLPAPRGWYLRQTEWEAAATVAIWADAGPRMRWRSDPGLEEKRDRALLLALALGAALLRAEERVLPAGAGPARPAWGRAALTRLGHEIAAAGAGWPEAASLPARARLLLVGDFLGPLPPLEALLAGHAARGGGGALVQVLDPAEETLPYAGRVRFEGLDGATPVLAPRAEALRDAYAARLAARRAALAALGQKFGLAVVPHRTDHPPGAALLAVWQALAGR